MGVGRTNPLALGGVLFAAWVAPGGPTMVLLEVPEGTVEIKGGAYKDRTDITVVRIPASVKAIGDSAFWGCTGITTLHLAEGLEAIRECAFYNCSGIVGLDLPASLRSIGDAAFDSCTGITVMHIPASVNHIGKDAFWACSGITALHLAEGLESIGENAFANCPGIVDLDLPEGLQTIGGAAFRACAGLETLVLPASLTSISDHDVYDGSFAYCTRLARVLAPDALVKGTMADPAKFFKGCPVLASGPTPLSAVKPPRRRFWHPTMHAWCTPAAKACVLAVLVAELRVDNNVGTRRSRRLHTQAPLPSLPHELWLLILEFAPRRELGAPPPPAV